jgi:hypothetical protein
MLWDYSPATNNHNKVQFLLPVYDAPKTIENNFASTQTETMQAETQQLVQKLFCEFLVQVGYTVGNTESAADNANALAVEDMLSMMQSFAFCAALRDRSTRPLLMLNRLMANVYEITERCITF